MANVSEIKLTDNSLENIQTMIPLLNEESREKVTYLLLGCCIGSNAAKDKPDKQLQEA